jgi:hypothetical protein
VLHRSLLPRSSPRGDRILTEISDCMTGEGKALDADDAAAAQGWAQRKEAANLALAACSQKYNGLMKELRAAGW